MIPKEYVNPRAMQLLMDYLREEINRALSERRSLEEKWLKHQRSYKTIPEKLMKEFPFLGASNLVLPIGAIDSDTIFSRLMGVLYGPENLWTCRALREDAIEYAPRLQEFLRWAQHNEIQAYGAVADFLLELCKLGTSVLKQRYRREQKLVYEFREMPQGILEQFARVMVQDNPVLEHVSLYDVLVPSGTIDHQQAPWMGERIMLTPQQLISRAKQGIYMGVDRVSSWLARDRGSWLRNELDRMQRFHPGLPNKAELWEVWLDYDIGVGEAMPLVSTVHLPTMTCLRVDWNPFFHQEYPFEVGRYLRQEKQFYGIGIMELQEMFQDEATAMHNQRIDNATLSNSVMMKGKKGIGLKEDEPIFPGRWFLVENMDDVQTLQFGRAYENTVGNEQMMLQYGTRRTGVNDYISGASSAAVGYATLGTNIQQHQEAAKRFDQTLRECRFALGGSGRRIVELYQQFNTQGKEYAVLGPRDGEIVNQILRFPLELIRHSVAVEVTATSASLNKETQIRTNTILMQLVTQFYQQTFEGMMMAVNPQMPPELRKLATQMVIGGATLMKRTLDSYDMQDVDRIIPDMQEILSGQQQQLGGLGLGMGGAGANGLWPQPVGPQGFGGGGPNASGILPASGLGLLQGRAA